MTAFDTKHKPEDFTLPEIKDEKIRLALDQLAEIILEMYFIEHPLPDGSATPFVRWKANSPIRHAGSPK